MSEGAWMEVDEACFRTDRWLAYGCYRVRQRAGVDEVLGSSTKYFLSIVFCKMVLVVATRTLL